MFVNVLDIENDSCHKAFDMVDCTIFIMTYDKKELKQVFAPELYLFVGMDKNLCTSYTEFRLSRHKLLV